MPKTIQDFLKNIENDNNDLSKLTNNILKTIYDYEMYKEANFKEEVPDLRIKTYSPPGREVGSSCGEFTKHYYHEEIETEEQREEFETWRNEHLIED